MTELMLSIQQDFSNVVESRKWAKKALFRLMAAWLFFVALLVVFNKPSSLEVSDGVMIALVSGAAAQVIGLYYVVAAHLFPKSGAIISPEVLDAINNIDRKPLDEDGSSFTVEPSSDPDSDE